MFVKYVQPLLILSLSIAVTLSTAQAVESQVITVGSSDSQSLATLSGTVIPFKEVTLTAQIPGRIEMISGREGDRFKQNDLLLSIGDDDLRAKRQAVQAQMANAQAAVQNAQVQYSRELYSPRSESPSSAPGFGLPIMMDNMFTKNMGSFMGQGEPALERHADLYTAVTGVNQAQATVMQTSSQLRELDAKIRDASAIAPFDGMVLRKMVEVGDTVQPGQALLSFGHIKYLRLQSEVPSRLVRGLKKGLMVSVLLNNHLETKARVAQVYPIADPGKHTVTVKFDLPQGIKAAPGMYAEIKVPGSAAGGDPTAHVAIPETALIRGRSLPAVLTVTGEGDSRVRLVRIGQHIGDNMVVVLSGLQAGQRIIDNPPPGVRSGWMPGKLHGSNHAEK
jgi:multidrug efflux pump subunit AcrA (membrane-fusion protein)